MNLIADWTWLDYVLVAVLALSAFQSFRRGFTREIIGLAAALGALLFGMWFYGTAGSLIRPHVSSDRLANLLGFLLVMGTVLVAGAIAGWIVSRFVKVIGLSFLDRLFGAVFGLVRGVLVLVALMTAWLSFGPNSDSKGAPDAVIHSQLAPYVMEASRLFTDAAPMELKTRFRDVYGKAVNEIRSMSQSRDSGRK